MASTKRRRQTKHRGNAAGIVESRGRTGRKPTSAEKSTKGRGAGQAREARLQRLERPPTWRRAFYRAMAAAVIVLLLVVLLLKKPGQVIELFPVVVLLYLPLIYYSDLWSYNRRMRSKAKRVDGKTATR